MSGGATGPPDEGVHEDPALAALTDVDRSELRHSTLQGVKWNFLATLAQIGGRFLFTLVLARILGPHSFGIIALATVYIAFTIVVLDQGFGVAIVQKRNLDPADIGTVTWLNIGTGIAVAAVTILIAPWVADFFHTPELRGVLVVLSSTMVIRGFTLVPTALVRRHLQFRLLAGIQTAAIVAGGVVGVVMAVLGARYWALVGQTVVTDLVTWVSLAVAVGRSSWSFSWARARSMWAFSTHLLGASALVFLGANADNFLVGRFETVQQLAFYALAYRLLRLPIQTVGSVVNGVALPVLSRLQDDDERTRSWFLVAGQSVALVSFPLFALLVVGAHDGIRLVFGPAWDGAVAPVQAMAVAGPVMIARMLLPPLATARAETALVLRWSFVTVALQVIGFVVGLSLGGMVGVAVSIPVVQYLTWLPNTSGILRPLHLGLTLRRYLLVLLAPTAVAGTAAVVWLAAEWLLHGRADLPLGVCVASSTVVAVAACVALLRGAWPGTFRSTVTMVRAMAGGAAV